MTADTAADTLGAASVRRLQRLEKKVADNERLLVAALEMARTINAKMDVLLRALELTKDDLK